MWFIIIFIVICIVVKFAYDNHQQGVKVNKEGGMVNKYTVLVEHLLSGHQHARIVRQSSTSIDLGVASSGGVTAFYLIQTFGSLTVKWKLQSPLFGNHNLEWTFPEYLDQQKMIDQMNNDLHKYEMNMLRAMG